MIILKAIQAILFLKGSVKEEEWKDLHSLF